MSTKTFWAIVFKLIGIYYAIQILSLISVTASTILQMIEQKGPRYFYLVSLSYSAIAFILYGIIIFLCAIKVDYLKHIFRIEKDIPEMQLRLDNLVIPKTAIIIYGIYTIINCFPSFVADVVQISWWQEIKLTDTGSKRSFVINLLTVNFIKVMLGWGLIKYNNAIVSLTFRNIKGDL